MPVWLNFGMNNREKTVPDSTSEMEIMMEDNSKRSFWQLYMYMLKQAINGEQIDKNLLDSFEQIDIESLTKSVGNQGQIHLLFQHVEAYRNYLNGSEKLYEGINGRVLLEKTMRDFEKYKILRRVLESGKNQSIDFVVFKGPVLADLYPQYIQRSSCDTDLFLPKKQKMVGIDLLQSLGYKIVKEHCKAEVTVFHHSTYRHTIELHTCLWEDFKGRRMDILDSFQLTDPSHFISLNVCGMDVTTLGYEDHLIYQMFHIIKHFSLEGVGCKYLADVTLYINQYKEKIDFDDFWDKMDQLGYTRFCYYFFTICVEFLGMDGEILGDKKVPMEREFYEFVSDLMRIGNSEDGKDAGWQIMGMMTPYFTGERGGASNSFQRKLQVIFPRAKDLPDDLMYAKKCPVLLPIAWVHKLVRYLIKSNRHKKDWYNAGEKLDVAEKRLALMSDMGLLDE